VGVLIGASESQQAREVPGIQLGLEGRVIVFFSVIGREREKYIPVGGTGLESPKVSQSKYPIADLRSIQSDSVQDCA
jgi:hypothetical protein